MNISTTTHTREMNYSAFERPGTGLLFGKVSPRGLVVTTSYHLLLLHKVLLQKDLGLPFFMGQGLLRKLDFARKRILEKYNLLKEKPIFRSFAEKFTSTNICRSELCLIPSWKKGRLLWSTARLIRVDFCRRRWIPVRFDLCPTEMLSRKRPEGGWDRVPLWTEFWTSSWNGLCRCPTSAAVWTSAAAHSRRRLQTLAPREVYLQSAPHFLPKTVAPTWGHPPVTALLTYIPSNRYNIQTSCMYIHVL